MAWYRIFSTMAEENGERAEDGNTKIVMHVRLDDDNRIDRRIQTFGYCQEYDEDNDNYLKYPFILEFDDRNEAGIIDYAGWELNSQNRLNIYNKVIKENEYFTRFEDRDEMGLRANNEYIYIIDRVVPI